jgi:hypothetical protein
VYWYGIDDFRRIERCVAHCAQRLPTLVDSPALPPTWRESGSQHPEQAA